MDDDFTGMKGAVHVACGVGGVKIVGDRAQPRDQVVDRGRSVVAQRGFKRNAASLRCNPERPVVIEP